MPESGEAGTTTVTSGRKCSALLAKSGPLGSLVRTLLESPLWSKEGYALTWEAVPLSLERVTIFTSTPCDNPSPSNESAETLNVSDIPSNRCLFRLRLSALPTEGTESSSSPLMLTPTSVMYSDTPEEMQARKKRNGYRNGTKYVNLETQLKYDPKYAGMLPTPQAMDGTDVRAIMGKNDELIETASGLRRKVQTGSDFGVSLGFMAKSGLLPTPLAVDVSHKKRVEANRKSGVSFKSRENVDARPNGLTDFLQFHGMLPTPTAGEGEKYTNTYNPNSQMGQSLSAMAGSGMLPTPRTCSVMGAALDTKGNLEGNRFPNLETVVGKIVCSPKTDGPSFRLSPLFTEEMMGFPFGWTTFPFLSQSGETNPSKPTETPSSRK